MEKRMGQNKGAGGEVGTRVENSSSRTLFSLLLRGGESHQAPHATAAIASVVVVAVVAVPPVVPPVVPVPGGLGGGRGFV